MALKTRSLLNIVTYMCVFTGCATVFQYIEGWYLLGFAVLLVFSVYSDFLRPLDLPRWILNIASIVVIVTSFLKISPDYLIEPILNALVILIGIKLLEDKKFRDYMQIYAMCMFLLIGSSLISFGIAFLFYFCILFGLSTAALMLLAYFSQDPEIVIGRENLIGLGRCSALICAISIPTCFLFFVILPRTNFPLLTFLNKFGFAKSGFSDTVSLGDVADIQEDNSVIFRAEMDPIDENMLFWRGLEMDTFDGATWRSSSIRSDFRISPSRGREITQTIYLEPYGKKYLFALDRPIQIYHSRLRFRDPLTHKLHEPIYERIKYQARSIATEFSPQPLSDRGFYLKLPQGYSPKIRKLVEDLSGDGERETVEKLLQFIKNGDLSYSLEDLPVSDKPLEDFLFASRKGNCEYFASAFAVMLRMANVPSRMIAGYRGGYYNSTGRYYMVLQKNAHVWVEAHIANQGWLRMDPTPYSVENPAAVYRRSILLRAKLLMDTFNYYWDKFVISYDLTRQIEIWRKMKASFSRPKPEFSFEDYVNSNLPSLLLLFIALAAGGCAYWLKNSESREKRILSGFLRKMAAHGYAKDRSEGLEEFVSRVDKDAVRRKAHIFVSEFQNIYYRDRLVTKEEAARLRERIRDL